jgi:hypothetical protein
MMMNPENKDNNYTKAKIVIVIVVIVLYLLFMVGLVVYHEGYRRGYSDGWDRLERLEDGFVPLCGVI